MCTSGSARGSRVVLPGIINMCMAVGLSILSWAQADIDVISYQLPLDSHHLVFPAYPDVGQSPQ